MAHRSVDRVVHAITTLEGEGFVVHRPFPTPQLDDIDPFLLLDRMGPVTLAAGEAKGAPDHPHRGFETVTYVLEGSFEHKDSRGNRGKLNSGDVQWMTAGGGVVHSEMPSEDIQRNGGRLHGFQLWVNLPRRDKMMKPRYQEIASGSIPSVTRGGVTVRVIAGESLGAKAVIETRTPIMYLHARLDAGARFEQPIPPEYNAFAFLVNGTARIDGREAGEDDAVIFGRDGDDVLIETDTGCELLLIGGVPINEPVARYGPFVMNTERELLQAFADFRSGRMGAIDF
jgi:redox-sensitive bicupin YhaK (pirin superfamily)